MGKGNTCRKKSGFFPSINSGERQHVSEKNRKIELKKTFFEIFFPRQKKIPEFFFSGCGGCHFFLDLPVFPDVLDLPVLPEALDLPDWGEDCIFVIVVIALSLSLTLMYFS